MNAALQHINYARSGEMPVPLAFRPSGGDVTPEIGKSVAPSGFGVTQPPRTARNLHYPVPKRCDRKPE